MPRKYPQEVKERTVRLLLDRRDDYPTEFAAMKAIASRTGVSAEAVRRWVRQAEIDAGVRDGVTSAETEQIRKLRAENKELKRANEILKAAAVGSRGGCNAETMTEVGWSALHGLVTLTRASRLRPEHAEQRLAILVDRLAGPSS